MCLFTESSPFCFHSLWMQSRYSSLKVYPEALRRLSRLPLHKNDNNIIIVKVLNLRELYEQNPTCKCQVFLEMPPLTDTRMHAHTVSWKDCCLRTFVNHLWELQTAAQGKIRKVQTANSKSKQATTQKFNLANSLFVRSLFFEENLISET